MPYTSINAQCNKIPVNLTFGIKAVGVIMQIESDLLYESITERAPGRTLLSPKDFDFFGHKSVLVTGAGGSIGARIAEWLMQIPNVKVLMTDRDENALHSLSLDLSNAALFQNPDFELLDIRDATGVESVIESFKPNYLIHCAALKHLSVLEKQPREAFLTNILGTNNLLRSSESANIDGFLNISTDKAAAPTSVLGYSKYIAEQLTSDYRDRTGKRFTSVRFGNVFNSRGSVIETFKHQIVNGLPITLTDSRVERYFMNTNEAAGLALKSLVLNAGGVHVLDMGEPILLLRIIENMQAHFGTNNPIVITGLRPGEKISEILANTNEEVIATEVSKVSTISSPNFDCNWIKSEFPSTNDEALELMLRFLSLSN
jgi:dTDP-glucose 4,6-dehydratase